MRVNPNEEMCGSLQGWAWRGVLMLDRRNSSVWLPRFRTPTFPFSSTSMCAVPLCGGLVQKGRKTRLKTPCC